MAIEVSKLTPNQQNELADALLAYHLVDPSDIEIQNPLFAQIDENDLQLKSGKFAPPTLELEAWPDKLPHSDEYQEISKLTVYALRLFRQARVLHGHSRSADKHYSGAEVSRITKASSFGHLGKSEIDRLKVQLNVAPNKSRSGADCWSVEQILALAIARQYCAKNGGLTRDAKKTLREVMRMYTQAAAFLDERNGTVGSVSQSRYGNAGHRRLRE